MLHVATNPQAEDQAAIIAVLHEETAAYLAKDFDRWAACWLPSERTTEVTSGAQGLLVNRGWETIAAARKQEMLDLPDPIENVSSDHINFQVTQDEDMAWVTYLTHCSCSGPSHFDTPDIFETRVLERFKGRWLISYMSVLSLRSGLADPTRVQVAAGGRILWAAPDTLALLKKHPHLTVSAGYLRARRQDWDKVLQQAIREAASYTPYEHFNTIPTDKIYNPMVPIILGEDENGGVQSCTVYPRDGATYVSFDDGHRITRSIATARMVFGLSDAQSRLCEAIASGLSLTAAAEALGITLNTARTHLSRVYDKTGVNSQTALVRVLLSVGIAAA